MGRAAPVRHYVCEVTVLPSPILTIQALPLSVRRFRNHLNLTPTYHHLTLPVDHFDYFSPLHSIIACSSMVPPGVMEFCSESQEEWFRAGGGIEAWVGADGA